MAETNPLRFSTLSGYLISFLIAAAMIWYLVLSISAPCLPCIENTLEYLFLAAFCLILVYSGSQNSLDAVPTKKKIMPVLFSPGEKVMSALVQDQNPAQSAIKCNLSSRTARE